MAVRLPQIGQHACTTLGEGIIERVYYGIITTLHPKRHKVMCTVVLTTPVKDKSQVIRRVEAEVPCYRSKRYE